MANQAKLFPSSSPPHVAAIRSEGVEISGVRFSELREVTALQKRAFKPRLAYGFATLLLLWSLPYVRFLVAREHGRIVGCAIGDRNSGQARVINICVDPSAQRQGIGTRLLRSLDAAIPQGDLVLMVEAENRTARNLYLREGFKEVDVSRNYYGRNLDGIWMQKARNGSSPPRFRISSGR
jgi:ribosomal-protein-alanine N-acetyltransferase